jgi:transcriptional regulator with XRE-family HTH domain
MVDFGNRLKTLRLRENMTQAQLASKLGVTKSVISAYETGLRLPSYDILIHIAEIYNVSTDHLLGVQREREIDLSGLTEAEIKALSDLIIAMKKPYDL